MPRPKKTDDKAKAAAASKDAAVEAASVQVDVDSFIRIRDSVVTGLATIQDALSTLSTAYIKHSNTILGDHAATLDIGNSLSVLQNNPLLSSGGITAVRAPSPPKSPVADGKKEKKKRTHDPLAPKRPLTPYFLYMQTARPIIANDLGPDVAKGAVSTEGVRRWNAMAPHDKQLWNSAYTDNLKLYNARMHSFKVGGNQAAKDMSDDEALHYADTHNIGVVAEPVTADAQITSEALLDAPADDDEELLPPPVAAPTPKGRGKPKAGAAATPSQPAGAIIPPGSGKPAPADGAATAAPAAAKRKRASKKGEDAVVASIEKGDESAAAGETPKGKGRKKAKAN